MMSSFTAWRRPLLAGLCFSLAACASLPAPHGDGIAPIARAYQAELDLSGRLSLSYQQNGQEQALHGSFDWHQSGAQLALTLRSPLGQTLAQIAVQDGVARLTQTGSAPQTAPNVDDLVRQTVGWPLPVAGLRFWLQGRGQQADGQPFQASPVLAQISTPDGWQLHYLSWHPDGSPKRIDLTRHTDEAGEVRLKLILNSATQE
jgi:outer membrane lipoprotein LolB